MSQTINYIRLKNTNYAGFFNTVDYELKPVQKYKIKDIFLTEANELDQSEPVIITNIVHAKAGKHGSAKFIFRGKGYYTSVSFEKTHISGAMLKTPIFNTGKVEVLYIDDDMAVCYMKSGDKYSLYAEKKKLENQNDTILIQYPVKLLNDLRRNTREYEGEVFTFLEWNGNLSLK